MWFGTFPKRRSGRGTTSISRVRYEKTKRGGASRVPPSPGAARRTRGVMVEGATPFFTASAVREGGKVDMPLATLPPPSKEGVAPSTVIPAGRLSSRPGSRQRKTADHKCPSGRERHAHRRGCQFRQGLAATVSIRRADHCPEPMPRKMRYPESADRRPAQPRGLAGLRQPGSSTQCVGIG